MNDEAQQGQILKALANKLVLNNLTLSSAESCTGGLISQIFTSASGCSQWYLGGVIAYSNLLKTDLLAVPESQIQSYGAVSESVAQSMAKGVMNKTTSDVSLSTTGIAGPLGGTPEKPVGTVCFAWITPQSGLISEQRHFEGDRGVIRQQSAWFSIKKMIQLL